MYLTITILFKVKITPLVKNSGLAHYKSPIVAIRMFVALVT